LKCLLRRDLAGASGRTSDARSSRREPTLVITSNPQLLTAAATAFASGRRIGGTVTISGNR
jgi:hypothetical protein